MWRRPAHIVALLAVATVAALPMSAPETVYAVAVAAAEDEDESREPPGRADDPPEDADPPTHPSTVLDQLRAPPVEQPAVRAFAAPSQNRIVGSLIAAGGPDVIAEAVLHTLESVTDRSAARGAGRDRYATALALSSAHFAEGATDVWIATGRDFPDGLTASSVAGSRPGPVLLTRPDAVGAGVLAELERLAPANIWVVGGPQAVSDSVLDAISAAAPGAAVERIGGQDRYATAAHLCTAFFPAASMVFVATGRDFPDALSAGPAAARESAPTLLVTRDDVPAATEAELRRLHPAVVYIVGGSAVVRPAVEERIAAITGGRVERVSGADRFATAAAVSDRFFAATTPSILLATGKNFPDSISAGAVAGALDSPLLLVDAHDTPPRVTVDAARRLSWWLPTSGRVLRYIVAAHPDDEFAAWSLIGARDPRRYDVVIVLTTGESTRHCNGEPVSNAWSSLQYMPQPQPTGHQYSDRCRKHRMDSWHVFASLSGLGAFGDAEHHLGTAIQHDGREVDIPLRRDATGEVISAGDYAVAVGSDAALVTFDLGALTPDEVLWAIQTARGHESSFPTQVEGDIIGAGFFNDASTGYENRHPDHEALFRVLTETDLGFLGSQYMSVGHGQSTRVFGASVDDYCEAMCHPGAPNAYVGEMGFFQYSYGWLSSGLWRSDRVDSPGGFAEYQSFSKAF